MKKKVTRKSPKSRPPRTLPELDLHDLASSRNAVAELVKAFYQRKMKDSRARTLAYLYQTFLSYLRLEAETEWQARLARIEEALIAKGVLK